MLSIKLQQLGKFLAKEMSQLSLAKKREADRVAKHFEFLSSSMSDKDSLVELEEIKILFNFEVDKKEAEWDQKAKANWLKFEDLNTTFFRSYATNRKWQNNVKKLKAADGLRKEDETGKLNITTEYFKKLFQTTTQRNEEKVLSSINQCIDDSMNEKLRTEFSSEEIMMAIKGMTPLKASSDGGLPALFFKNIGQL